MKHGVVRTNSLSTPQAFARVDKAALGLGSRVLASLACNDSLAVCFANACAQRRRRCTPFGGSAKRCLSTRSLVCVHAQRQVSVSPDIGVCCCTGQECSASSSI